MKKYYYGVLFVLLNINLSAQEFKTEIDPVDSSKVILKEKADTEIEPVSMGADSSDLVVSILNRITLEYEDLAGLENLISNRRKAISSLKNIASKLADTTYNKHSKNVLFESFEGNYKMFIDQVDTFDIVIEKTASGNTRIRETGLSASQARKYNVIPYTSQSIEVRNITVGSKKYDVVLYQSKTNEKVYKTLPKSIDPVYPEWIIPKIKIRRKK